MINKSSGGEILRLPFCRRTEASMKAEEHDTAKSDAIPQLRDYLIWTKDLLVQILV